MEEDLADLEDFIYARGKYHRLGGGITTYTDKADERNRNLHEACLELERRGRIKRFNEGDGWVIWVPTEKP
jgi:hypothetical protein